ncbi:MAG: hypoxanthine phosphoribosyltransferase [Saprospiraceae bacterium]|nr:hypoxanthine phosphoribosyltransferase [Saprospiraceae bacterium]
MDTIKLHDKTFVPFISRVVIEGKIKTLANQVYQEYKDLQPTFLVILNGAVFFAVDFLKEYHGPCNINFMRLKSYEGTQTSGSVKLIDHLPPDLKGKHIIVLEDIVDTGITMSYLKETLQNSDISSLKVVSLLDKPSRRIKDFKVDLVGFTIPDVFVVGYGLDYDELGRNTADIYKLSEK